MKFSVVIPAHNEAENLPATVAGITQALAAASLDHEIVMVNDGSSDDTEAVAARLASADERVRLVTTRARMDTA